MAERSGDTVPSAVPSADPLVPAGFAGWLRCVAGTVRRSLGPLLLVAAGALVLAVLVAVVATVLIALLVGAGGGRAAGVAGAGAGAALAYLVVFAVYTVGQVAALHVVVTRAAGQRAGLGRSVSFALRRAFPLVGWLLLVGVGVLAVSLPVGWLLGPYAPVVLALPWLYVAVVLAAGLPGVVVVERRGLARCFALVHGRFWPVAGRMLLYFAVVACYVVFAGVAAAGIGELFGGGGSVAGGVVAGVLRLVLLLPLMVLTYVVPVVTYAELRFHDRRRPVAGTAGLAAELGS